MVNHVDIIVSGIVQGVGFRANAKRLARKLGLTGWVKNFSDQTVHLSVEGNEKMITIFTDWLHKGSMLAQVEKVEIHTGDLEHFETFEIRRDTL
jgi:acylphosphatase